MQHVGTGGQSDVRAVIDRQEGAVAVRRLAEHRGRLEQWHCFGLLVAELEHVDPGAEDRVREAGQVRPERRAQVQPGGSQPLGALARAHQPLPAGARSGRPSNEVDASA